MRGRRHFSWSLGVSPVHLKNDSPSISLSFWFHGFQAKTFLEAKKNILGLSGLKGGIALLDTAFLISGQSSQGLGESRSETLGTVFSTRLFLVGGEGSWTVCILIPVQSLTWLSTLGWPRGLVETIRVGSPVCLSLIWPPCIITFSG